jgi:type I restriction enzyme S subunit
VLRPVEPINGTFWSFLLKSKSYIEALQTMTDGIRDGKNISYQQFGQIRLPVAPLPEQTRIAAFLDQETAKIDELVAEQQRLMALLKEKRQAVISHAVTKGLNPKAPMKPSGIEWLGQVPAHWETKPLKAVAKLFGRIGFRGYTTEDIVDEGEGAVTLSPSNMVEGKLALEKCTFISWAKYNESPEIQIVANNVLIVKTGSTFGKTAFVDRVDQPMTINPQIAVFKNIICAPRFLFHVLNTPAIQSLIEISNKGSTIPTMTQEAVGNFWIGLPPHGEQIEIVAFIDAEQAQLNELTAEAQRAIDLLQERRTALISAAVTGQIDVRPGAPVSQPALRER